MLLTKKTINKLSGFNESFKMYYEDVDLCFRAKKMNINCFFVSDCRISHHISYSLGGSFSFLKIYNKIRSFINFLYNHNNLYLFTIYLLINAISSPFVILLIIYKKIFG